MAIQISGTTVIDNSKNVTVGASASITAGSAFIANGYVGLGVTDTTGRDAGVGTATGTMIYNESSVQVELWDGTAWVGGLTSPFSATGGTKDTTSRSGYAVHTFTGSGTLVAAGGPPAGVTGEYLVIGGGGAGGDGSSSGGGGGGGLLRFSDSFTLTPGTYTIGVGAGGAIAANPGYTAPSYGVGNPGSPSYIVNPGITSITSPGGGGGGGGGTPGASTRNGLPGGSGGGGGSTYPTPGPSVGGSGTGDPGGTTDSNSPANGWGNDGGAGNHFSNGQGGGGGGGAGGNGGNWIPPSFGGPGGVGLTYSIDGSSTGRAGGGNGALNSGLPVWGGGSGWPFAGGTATVNTGGGGGGSANGISPNSTGASGIVIIAYPTA